MCLKSDFISLPLPYSHSRCRQRACADLRHILRREGHQQHSQRLVNAVHAPSAGDLLQQQLGTSHAQVLGQLALNAHHLCTVVVVLCGLRKEGYAVARGLAGFFTGVVVREDMPSS